MTRMSPRMLPDAVLRLLHELGNGRALENARRERDEHAALVARIEALTAALAHAPAALPAAA